MLKRRNIRNADRFGALPDEVAHAILEFVSTKDISLLSCVSKRCRHLCLSTPFVNFDDLSARNDPLKRAHLMNYADRILHSRSFFPPVFRMNWSELSGEQEEYRCLSWLHRAVSSNIKELHLVVDNVGSGFALPSNLVSCTSLEVLFLRFKKGIVTLKTLPTDFTRFPPLKSLTLDSVWIEKSLFDWISQCCKCLTKLHLHNTKGTSDIAITSSSLRYLGICDVYNVLHLQVNAENLYELRLLLLTTDSSEAPKLVTPKLHVTHQIMAKRIGDNRMDLSEHSGRLVRAKCYPVTNYAILQFSCKLQHMRVFGDSIEELHDSQRLPIQMPNLVELIMHMSLATTADYLVSVLASFLRGTPKLKYLLFCFSNRQGDVKMVPHGRPPRTLKRLLSKHKLRSLKLAFPYGVQKSKLELIDYFINSAEEIDIICPLTPLPSDVDLLIKGYKKKVNVIQSSNCLREFVVTPFISSVA